MKKFTTLVAAAVMVAGMSVSASAQQTQVNETPTQGLAGLGAGLSAAGIAAIAVVVVGVVAAASSSSGTAASVRSGCAAICSACRRPMAPIPATIRLVIEDSRTIWSDHRP